MSQHILAKLGGYLRQHWRRVSLFGLGGLAGLMILVQLVYPWGNMPLYQVVDGVDVSGRSSQDVQKILEDRYKTTKVSLYFGKSPKPYREPVATAIGISIDNKERVVSAQYSWWLRLVPTSLWWAHAVTTVKPPVYGHDSNKAKAYVSKELGESCDITSVNASLEFKDKKLDVIPAIDGGTCELANVEKLLDGAKPTLVDSKVRIPMVERPAKIHEGEAQAYADKLLKQTEGGVQVTAASQKVVVSQQDLLSWLDFTAPDAGVIAKVNADRSKAYFEKELAPKVAITPGVSKVTTLDFVKIAEVSGSGGQALDGAATVQAFDAWLVNSGNKVVAKTKAVPPTIAYTRTYTPTDTGIAALIAQFVEARPGTFGVSFAELDGKRRHAAYQADKMFRTASTYKLFVAYGVFKRVESGVWRWTDQIHGGRDLAKCIDDMIVKSDNPCGEVLLSKIGYKVLTDELKAIGLTKSSFVNNKGYPETTAGDLTMFVGALQSGQLLNAGNTTTFLTAMKRNIYRQGVPAGANGQTADKVGFLDKLLHDAAIVYSPSGTYALSIMTDGSSWATIAELTREIEKLRTQG